MNHLDEPFLAAADVAISLLERPELATGWAEPSVLARMSVGALACHLGRQVVRAEELLGTPPQGEPLAEVDEHYRRAAWVSETDLGSAVHDRTTDEREAADGVEALRARVGAARTAVAARLRERRAESMVTIPWQGWSLRRDDFLTTRLVELVTHTDDLACSLSLPTPPFPPEAYHPVAHLLVRLAAERHGQAALTSALTRRERMPDTISAF
ncbi:hypothetical protein ASG90_18945 [Nocardioides sp. Soil797]|nr:hypothetical protein ASG90_18945 [Nocardioides sp. Soil797]